MRYNRLILDSLINTWKFPVNFFVYSYFSESHAYVLFYLQNIFGISINNEFRLGTVFTAVLVFEDVQSNSFHPQPPVDVYFTQAEKIMLLSWVNGLTKPPFVPDDHGVDEVAWLQLCPKWLKPFSCSAKLNNLQIDSDLYVCYSKQS